MKPIFITNYLHSMAISFRKLSCIFLILLSLLLSFAWRKTPDLSCPYPTSVSNQIQSQSQEEIPRFLIFQKRKWGFINEAGKVIIQPEFSYIRSFYENRAAFKKGNKWGFIDPNGKVVIAPQFDHVGNFIDGRSVFKKGNKWGLTDPNGRFIFEPKLDGIGSIFEGRLAFMRDGKWGLMDVNGKIVIEPYFERIGKFSEGFAIQKDKRSKKIGFIDRNGQVVIELPDDVNLSFDGDIASITFKNGRVAVYAIDPGLSFIKQVLTGQWEDLWGYIDRSGRQVIPLKYNAAYKFSECLAQVKIGNETGFINLSGQMVIEPKVYESVSSFHEGRAAVRIKEKWGYIDASGKMVIKPLFDAANRFVNGLATVDINGKWGQIDRTGKIVIQPQFDSPLNFDRGLANVSVGNKWGYINRQGKFVWFSYLAKGEKINWRGE